MLTLQLPLDMGLALLKFPGDIRLLPSQASPGLAVYMQASMLPMQTLQLQAQPAQWLC